MRGEPKTLPEPIPGNEVTLLRDGDETFPAMLEGIAHANRYVHLEVFIWQADAIGHAMADALIERARAGVEVRAVYDAVGSLRTSESLFARMRAAGIEVFPFHPLAFWKRRWAVTHRNHRKNLIIDGEVGFAGGLNFDVCHASKSQGGADWRDTHCRVRGPAVAEMDGCFRDVWRRHAPPGLSALQAFATPAPPAGRQTVRIVANRPKVRRSEIRRAYLSALLQARSHIWITNPYFLPDARLLRALLKAVRRGVDVRILVPKDSDVKVCDLAARPIFRYLVHRGVQIHVYRRAVLHAKTAVVDGRWATVGSFNLDPASASNLELNVIAEDTTFARQLEDAFREDLLSSAWLVPTRVDRSPAHLRLAEWTMHGLRHWL